MSILSSLRIKPPVSDEIYHRWVDTPNFSYKEWLVKSGDCIANVHNVKPRIAIIGAGAAGLCAAYELQKCGVEVDVFEASGRAGGRLDSDTQGWNVDDPKGEQIRDPYNIAELGAMRFPESEELLFYYLKMAPGSNKYPQFPDPGVVPTLISYRDEKPILWQKLPDKDVPPAGFEVVSRGWNAFVGSSGEEDFVIHSKNTDVVPDLTKLSKIQEYLANGQIELVQKAWQVYLDTFGALSFFDGLMRIFGSNSLWYTPGKKYTANSIEDSENTWNTDDFNRFGTLGVGSGGFGTLYAVGFNTVARLMCNGLETNQLLIPKGTKTLIEFFMETVSVNLEKEIVDVINVGVNEPAFQLIGADNKPASSYTYHKVIWATNLRAMSMSPAFIPKINKNDVKGIISQNVISAINNTHVINSSKLFLRTAMFWLREDMEFPRVILSDIGFQQVYTLDYFTSQHLTPTEWAPGMVIISYTWEDNSSQTLPLTACQRLDIFKKQIANIHPEFAAALVPYRQGSYEKNLVMVDWQATPYQYGAFALNQAGQDINVQKMFFDYLKAKDIMSTELILAGDSISWCGGWVESALQTGLNAAAAVIASLGVHATFSAQPSPMDLNENLFNYNCTTTRSL